MLHGGSPVDRALPDHAQREVIGDRTPLSMSRRDWVVIAAVLIFYAATRFYALEDFPIYFFCDEAIQANIAQNLVDNDLRDQFGRLLPAYFLNVENYSLSLTVWIYAVPVVIFGKSVLVVRATSVCVGIFGVASLMLALKWFFGARLWWAGGLVMAALPAWFIHSRTGFETPFMVSFYAMFVLTYLLYREHSAWWLPAAVACGAATFYSYANGQGVMFISCLLLVIVDWRYHWRVVTGNRKALSAGVLAMVLVSAPYLHFRFVRQPGILSSQLEHLGSYWASDEPLDFKLATFGRTYLRGMGPGYWFTVDPEELIRHRIPGRPYLPVWLVPPILLGVACCLWRGRRSAAHRLALIGVLAAPFSASLVGLEITRVLAGVVPATLFAVIGLDTLRHWVGRCVPSPVFGAALGLGLVSASTLMTVGAVRHGGTWYDEYGLYGMQWGARQLFGRVLERMAIDPDGRFAISYEWANNPGSFGDFFLTPRQREHIRWVAVEDLLREEIPEVNPSYVFVLTPEDYRMAIDSPELDVGAPLETIPYPDGRPGFYFVRLAYSARAKELLAARLDPRKFLVEDGVAGASGVLRVLHPELDTGVIALAFDGDLETLARTRDAQTTIVGVEFPEPRAIAGVRLHLWTGGYDLVLKAVRLGGEVAEVSGTGSSPVGLRPMDVMLPESLPDVISIEISITKSGDGHVHLREIELL